MKMNIKLNERGRRTVQKPEPAPYVDVGKLVQEILESRGFSIDPMGFADTGYDVVAYKEIYDNIRPTSKICILFKYDTSMRSVFVEIIDSHYRTGVSHGRVIDMWKTGIFSNFERVTEKNVDRYITAAESAAEHYIQAKLDIYID